MRQLNVITMYVTHMYTVFYMYLHKYNGVILQLCADDVVVSRF